MNDRVNGGVQVQPGSVARTLVPQPPLLEGPPVHPLEFYFQQMDVDRQYIRSQIKNLQEQQKELVDGQKMMMTFFEKFPDVRQHETARDLMTKVPIVTRGKDYGSVGVQVLESSYRSSFLRLGKQALLDNQTERVHLENVVAAAYHPAVSQGVLSSASVIGISRWRYPRTSPEHQPQTLLEGRLGQNHEFSPDLPARKPVRFLVLPRHREGGVEDRPADPREREVRRIVEDHPANPRRVEVPAPAGCLPILDLTEETLLDRMEEWLRLRRGGQDKVHQPLGNEPLTARIRISQLPVGWVTPEFSRFDEKGDPD